MKIFIMTWNILEHTQKMAEFFVSCGHEPIIVDNCSTYPPLLEWYKNCPYKVVSTQGVELQTYNRFVWEIPGLLDEVENYYAVTDCDLGFEGVPKDFCEVLTADIERSEGIIKSGLSIRLSDLPDNPYANRYREAEKNNYNNVDPHGFYGIPVDTTFAVYSKDRCNNLDKMWRPSGDPAPESFLDNSYFYRSHRSPEPYTVQHLPWYMDINNLTEEQQYHLKVTRHGSILFFKQVYAAELLEKYNITEHWIDPKNIDPKP